MRINYRRSHFGMVGAVFLLMALTLYMAFAGPYSLFNLKQKETSEIKTVIVVARHGDVWPAPEAFFPSDGPERRQKRQQDSLAGQQLTNMGKERMYLLGKFLRLRYYERLLAGDPQRLSVRSANSDRCLESGQLLAAGLNPPRASSVWSSGTVDEELASRWQPKAVRASDERLDELLSSRSNCLLNFEQLSSGEWKNSSKYLQLLNEFRHDLQVLRLNTGLEFEDDLEMLADIEQHLRARSARGQAPAWYTDTWAQRLAHISTSTLGAKFGRPIAQRLYAGRLLDVVARTIFAKMQAARADSFTVVMSEDEEELDSLKATELSGRQTLGRQARALKANATETTTTTTTANLPYEQQPSMSLYLTDRQHLTALLNALKIYSAQPHYGFLLIIELHHEPSSGAHFLRLFTVNSLSHNTFPEPVRVNPVACPLDSAECSPEQFEQNTRHLAVDKRTWWQQLCKDYTNLATPKEPSGLEQPKPEQPGDEVLPAKLEQKPEEAGQRPEEATRTTIAPVDLAANNETSSTLELEESTTTTTKQDRPTEPNSEGGGQ